MRANSSRLLLATAVLLVVSLVDPRTAASGAAAAPPTLVTPSVETTPGQHAGDTMDDPAIWVHPTNPSQSLVLANDKGGALETYNLDGSLVQRISDDVTFWGNVDVRQDVTIGGVQRDIVGVSHRQIQLYAVNPATRQLTSITEGLAVGSLGEGFCLYDSPTSGKLYAINITLPGRLRQYELRDQNGNGLLEASLVRDFQVGSESEGCVVDDATGSLFVSEEDVALWQYDAEPTGGTTRTPVDRVVADGGHLAPDIEGVTLVRTVGGGGYLIASAQNVADPNNSFFAVYQRAQPHAFVSSFRVGNGTTADDCDRTDGVAAYAGNLGPSFPQGVFVCQDNNNDPPGSSGNQNLKLVRLERAVDLTPATNQSPSASFTRSCTQLACTFDASDSEDPDGTIDDYAWDFGDDTGTVHGSTPAHTYAAAGSYPVTLTVTDNDDATDTSTVSITVTSGTPNTPISFVGQNSSPNANATKWTATIPASTQAGDTLLLFFSTGSATTPGPGAGWQQVTRTVDSDHATTVWQRTATAADAGDPVQVTSTLQKGVLTVAGYRGTDPSTPLAAHASTAQPATTTQHTTPTLTSTTSGWRISYWSTKSSDVTTLTPPAGETTRTTTNTTGSGRITTLLTDSAANVPTGTQGARTATTNTAVNKATLWTLILAPSP